MRSRRGCEEAKTPRRMEMVTSIDAYTVYATYLIAGNKRSQDRTGFLSYTMIVLYVMIIVIIAGSSSSSSGSYGQSFHD